MPRFSKYIRHSLCEKLVGLLQHPGVKGETSESEGAAKGKIISLYLYHRLWKFHSKQNVMWAHTGKLGLGPCTHK